MKPFTLFILFLSCSFSLFASQNLDVNGDGNADILWRNQATGQSWLWTMNGVVVDESKSLNTIPLNWEIVGRGDFDGDGKSDIFWRNNDSGRNYIYLMDGFTIRSSKELNYLPNFDWKVKGITDLNGDGKDDVIWQHQKTGQTWIYLLDGVSITSSKSSNTVSDLAWNIVGTGDVDGDGHGDVIWRHSTSGKNFIWLMNGTAVKSSYVLNTVTPSWHIVGLGDLNGDNTDDIIWRSESGINWAYLMSGGQIGTSKQINKIENTDWQIRTIGDLNGDGKADIFWRNQSTGKTFAYLMDGTSILSAGYSSVISLNWQIISESTLPTSGDIIIIPEGPDPRVEEAEVYFTENISAQILQTKCVMCHTSTGLAQNARLIIENSSTANYQTINQQRIADFLTLDGVDSTYFLTKVIGGLTHSGGTQVKPDSDEYKILLTYFDLVNSIGSNWSPIANAGEDTSVNEGSSIILSGNGTDSDGSISSYQWIQTTGVTVSINNANTASISFSAPLVTKDEELTFILTVTDNEGANTSDSVNISIINLNTEPVATVEFPTSFSNTNKDIFAADIVFTEVVNSLTFDLGEVNEAFILFEGQKYVIENNTIDVSALNSKEFQLVLNHNLVETITIGLKSFTASGSSYNEKKSTQNIAFIEETKAGSGTISINFGIKNKSIVNTNAPTQVVKGETPTSVYLSGLTQTIEKYNADLDVYQAYYKESISLTDSNKIQYYLPEGKYIIYFNATRNIKGRNIAFKTSLSTEITVGGWSSNHISMQNFSLSSDDVEQMNNYDAQFVKGETKDLTIFDLMLDVNGLPMKQLASFFNYHSYDVLSSTNDSVTIRYYLTTYTPSIFHVIKLTANLSARVAFTLPSMDTPIVYNVSAGNAVVVDALGEIPVGENTIDITITNVELNGSDLEYSIGLGITDLSGENGGTYGIGPMDIKTVKVKE
jgi:hypothetical protein